jgi:cysteine desulfuration protein SufE
MKNNINKTQDEIINDFSKLNDWFDKYEFLIQLGKNLEPVDEEILTDENSINGCQSQLWLKADINNGKIHYFAYSDSLIVKGMLFLLLKVLNDNTPHDIIKSDLYFINKIGLTTNLSPSRANGLMNIVKQIRLNAINANKIE